MRLVGADIVGEAILREIASAGRWYTVELAWQALVNMRRIAEGMDAERDLMDQAQCRAHSATSDDKGE